MLASTHTFTLDGLSILPVRVEVYVGGGPLAFVPEGLPKPEAEKARRRVFAALVSSGFELPDSRIHAMFIPTHLRRAHPSGLDLPLAAALLLASIQLPPGSLSEIALVGKLRPDGSLRAVPGVAAIAGAARANGLKALVVPEKSRVEAASARIETIALGDLRELSAMAVGRGVAR